MKVLVLTNMYPTSDNPAFGTFVADQVKDIRAAGVEVDVLLVNGRESSLNYIKGFPRLWKQLRQHKYDLIHAHYTFSGLIAKAQWSCPVVLTYHGSEIHADHTPTWLYNLSKLTTRLVQRVIVVSEQMKKNLGDASVTVIPCAINLDHITPIDRAEARQQLNLAPDKPLVLWAGQPQQAVKRIHIVKDAIEIVKKTRPEAELIILSGQPHSVVPAYMSACDALALTSSHEGSPMVIKEAMACNLPLVSTDVGDVAQVIDGVEGCYLSGPDPQDVAEYLLKILASGQRTKGRQKIAYLSSENVTQQIISIYNQLCPPQRRITKEGNLRV